MMPAARKGRRTLEQEETISKYQKIIQKLDDHEDSMMALLVPKKRRMTGKKSQEENEIEEQDEQRDWPSSKSSKTVQYRYSEKQGCAGHVSKIAGPCGRRTHHRPGH